MQIFDVFFLEAVLNGLLFGGVLALLALGLNLVFGVIDVVWICYAELMMIGMYTVYFLYTVYKLPLVVAFAAGILVVAVCGVLLHVLVIRPVLNTEPINQLLVTGGVLFFLQAAATLAFGVQFRNLGLAPALPRARRDLPSLLAHLRCAHGVGRDGGAVSLPQEDLPRHGDPRDQPGPPDHAADGGESRAGST